MSLEPPDPPSLQRLASFPSGGLALVVGASGGIGGEVAEALGETGRFASVRRLGRREEYVLDLEDEVSIEAAARRVRSHGLDVRLVFDATGLLHDEGLAPEKSLRQLDPRAMARSYRINAIGPALLMKHFLPLLPKAGKAVFATLSARVGSIGDNRLGGWHSYRASKAALNQLVRTASIELRLTHPEAICVALHPGTVNTDLSAPFSKTGLDPQSPRESAAALLRCIDGLSPAQSGTFLDRTGEILPW